MLTTVLLSIPDLLFSQQSKNSATVAYGNNPSAGKYISTRGIKIYYEVYGSGETLLLTHGNGGSIKDFKYQIPYFSKYYKVIAVDSRAQGKSVDDGDSISYEMMADDLNAVLDSLHISSTDVIGWSDGGINGLLLALRHPDKVKKLAETGANLIPDTSVFDSKYNADFDKLMKDYPMQNQSEDEKNEYKLLHMMVVAPNIPDKELHRIKCPVLVIGGDHDIIKPSHTLEIFSNIPDAYLWIVPNAGHATLQKHHDEFNEYVHQFFTHPYVKPKYDDWE